MADIPEINRTTYGRDGEFGLSMASWGAGIMYNKDLLAKVGATEPPPTWDEFLGLCRKLKAAGITPYLESLDGMPIMLAGVPRRPQRRHRHGMDAKIFGGSATFAADWTEPLTQYNRIFTEGLVTADRRRAQGRPGARRVRQGQARDDADRARGTCPPSARRPPRSTWRW